MAPQIVDPSRYGRGPLAPRWAYASNFPATENPISENGFVLSGARDGSDWSDFRTSGGLTYGTQANSAATPPYNDSLAVLKGAPPNHAIQATCHVEAGTFTSGFHELGLHVRKKLSANASPGYEYQHAFDGAYGTWVWWQGLLNQFIQGPNGANLQALTTGTILKATAIGNIITAYANYGSGLVIISQLDITVASNFPGTTTDGHSYAQLNDGNPGLDHWNHGVTSSLTSLAYSGFSAEGL